MLNNDFFFLCCGGAVLLWWCHNADLKGRKFVLLLSFCVCALELLMLSLVPTVPVLFVARALSGLGDVGASTTYTIITDIATHNQDEASGQYWKVGALLGLAFVVGPAAGGLLCAVSTRLCLLVAGICALIGAVLGALLLEETVLFAAVEHRSSPLGNEMLLKIKQEREQQLASNLRRGDEYNVGSRTSLTTERRRERRQGRSIEAGGSCGQDRERDSLIEGPVPAYGASPSNTIAEDGMAEVGQSTSRFAESTAEATAFGAPVPAVAGAGVGAAALSEAEARLWHERLQPPPPRHSHSHNSPKNQQWRVSAGTDRSYDQGGLLGLGARMQAEGTPSSHGVLALVGGVFSALQRHLSAVSAHFHDAAARELAVPYALCSLGGGYVFVWYLYMHVQFSAPPERIGLYLSFSGLLTAGVQSMLLPRLVPAVWREQDAARVGLLLTSLQALGYCFCAAEWQLYLLAVLCCLGSISFPSVKTVVVLEALRQQGARYVLGNMQGVLSSISTLAMACGALLFSVLFALGAYVDASSGISGSSSGADPGALGHSVLHTPVVRRAAVLPFALSAALHLTSLLMLHGWLHQREKRMLQASAIDMSCRSPPPTSSAAATPSSSSTTRNSKSGRPTHGSVDDRRNRDRGAGRVEPSEDAGSIGGTSGSYEYAKVMLGLKAGDSAVADIYAQADGGADAPLLTPQPAGQQYLRTPQPSPPPTEEYSFR